MSCAEAQGAQGHAHLKRLWVSTALARHQPMRSSPDGQLVRSLAVEQPKQRRDHGGGGERNLAGAAWQLSGLRDCICAARRTSRAAHLTWKPRARARQCPRRPSAGRAAFGVRCR